MSMTSCLATLIEVGSLLKFIICSSVPTRCSNTLDPDDETFPAYMVDVSIACCYYRHIFIFDLLDSSDVCFIGSLVCIIRETEHQSISLSS